MQLSRLLRFISLSRTGTEFPGLSANLLQLVRSLTPAPRLPVDAACTQGKEGIPALAIYTYTLDALCPQHNAFCTSMERLSRCPKNVCSVFFYLLPFPSLAFSLVVSWLNVSIEEYLNNHTTVYQHHHGAHRVHPASHCALLSCRSMSSIGKRKTGVHIIIFLLLYELQPV